MTAQRRERSLTIHHVTPHFYPEIGGLEESVRRLGVWFVRRGHRVVVHTSSLAVSGNTLPTLDSIDGIEIRRSAPIVRRGYFRTWFRPDLEGADLIHLHGYAVRTNDRVIRTDPGAPVVFSLHHGVRMVHRAASTRVLRAVYDRFVGLPTLRRVDSILVPSRGDVEWLAGHRIPKERVHLIPTPVPDEAFLAGNPAWARSSVGSGRFVLYLGRIHAEKGVGILLETVPSLPKNVQLVYAGPDGGQLGALKARAQQLGIVERVRFLGAVTEDQKKSLLVSCSVLVLPSMFEAQGISVVEAWAQSRPVVVTEVGALPELVRDQETGVLVPFGDPRALAGGIRAVIEHPERGAEMGRRGREVAESFRAGNVLPAVERVYDELT